MTNLEKLKDALDNGTFGEWGEGKYLGLVQAAVSEIESWRRLQILKVKPDDILICTTDDLDFQIDEFKKLVDITGARGVMLLPKDGKLSVSTDDELEKYGLMRIPDPRDREDREA